MSEETTDNKGKPGKRKGKGNPNPKPGNPPSSAELLRRLRVVETALIDGKRGSQVMEYLNDTLSLKCPYSTVATYMRRVRDKWENEDAMLRPIWRERQMRKLHEVARTLENGQHWGHWIAVQKLIMDLEGNAAPTKLDVAHRSDPFEGWTVQELEKYIESRGQYEPERLSKSSKGNGRTDEVWPGEGVGTVH